MVGEVGQEVEEIVENGGFKRSLDKGVEFLVDVEHHHNRQQQYDGEDIGSEELTDDVAVENLEHTLRVGGRA